MLEHRNLGLVCFSTGASLAAVVASAASAVAAAAAAVAAAVAVAVAVAAEAAESAQGCQHQYGQEVVAPAAVAAEAAPVAETAVSAVAAAQLGESEQTSHVIQAVQLRVGTLALEMETVVFWQDFDKVVIHPKVQPSITFSNGVVMCEVNFFRELPWFFCYQFGS